MFFKHLCVSDGIFFSILASLSVFSINRNGRWTIQVPRVIIDQELIRVAKTAYMEIAHSTFNKMGEKKVCYSALAEKSYDYKKFQDYISSMKGAS